MKPFMAALALVAASLSGIACLSIAGSAAVAATSAEEFPAFGNWSIVRSGPRSWRVVSGGTLKVVMASALDSETANIGDSFQARLAQPLRSGGRTYAPAGSLINGHVTAVDKATRLLKADLPSHHWLDANGALGLSFDTVIESGGRTISLGATPLPDSPVVRANATADKLDVDKRGEVTVVYNGVKYGALDTAIGGAALATGPVGLIAGPLVSGIAGAISPAMSFGRPSDDVEGHRRVKGFFLGMFRGLPGGSLITEAKEHGEEVSLSPGDEITLMVNSSNF